MIHHTTIQGKNIIIRGIGKMFYQNGYPIGMLANELRRQGYIVSWLHVADELQKHGWQNKTILSRLGEEITDSGSSLDTPMIQRFLESDYEHQRIMMFNHLFRDKDVAKEWFKENVL